MGEIGSAASRLWEIPASIVHLSEEAAVTVTSGIPRETWNGMSDETFHIIKNGVATDVHLLASGLHPASAGEAELRFAWSPERRKLWDMLIAASGQLRDEAHAKFIIGGGSMFHSDKGPVGDIDALVVLPMSAPSEFAHRSNIVRKLSAAEGQSGLHLIPISESPNIARSSERVAHEVLISQERHPAGQLTTGAVLLNVEELAAMTLT